MLLQLREGDSYPIPHLNPPPSTHTHTKQTIGELCEDLHVNSCSWSQLMEYDLCWCSSCGRPGKRKSAAARPLLHPTPSLPFTLLAPATPHPTPCISTPTPDGQLGMSEILLLQNPRLAPQCCPTPCCLFQSDVRLSLSVQSALFSSVSLPPSLSQFRSPPLTL